MCRSVSRKRETGVWICSTKTVGSVILYEVTFAIPNIVSRDAIFEGTIWRRYSQFAALHELLQRVHIVDARLRREKLQPLPELPPKTLLPVVYAGDPQSIIQQRQKSLEQLLIAMVSSQIPTVADMLRAFLTETSCVPAARPCTQKPPMVKSVLHFGGTLSKRGEWFSGWNERWFRIVLNSHDQLQAPSYELSYYSNPGDASPRGYMPQLCKCAIVPLLDLHSRPFSFALFTAEHTLVLDAHSKEQYTTWMCMLSAIRQNAGISPFSVSRDNMLAISNR
mmetsp:Transcript_21265/g.40482  ORF Transcript_21265/g.40482 Transcript_21265/m.40482 type:complete len:279 (-) Transcript_21265:98-934(-)